MSEEFVNKMDKFVHDAHECDKIKLQEKALKEQVLKIQRMQDELLLRKARICPNQQCLTRAEKCRLKKLGKI